MPALPYIWAEALFAIRFEMARTVTDVLKRRLPARFLDSVGAVKAAEQVGKMLAAELSIPSEQIDAQVAEFTSDVRAERELLGLD